MTTRKLALVCATPAFDGGEMPLPMPSFGIHRVHAAALAGIYPHPVDVRVFDVGSGERAVSVEEVLDFAPDILGCSAYVWSLAKLLELSQRMKRNNPEIITLLGGPSARRHIFELPHYKDGAQSIDALCEGDGEVVMQALLSLRKLSATDLHAVPGIWIRNKSDWSWIESMQPAPYELETLASPYQMGLMPSGEVAYLETYRGCPLSCDFCAWGATRPPREVFSKSYIRNELEAFRMLRAPAVFLLDAGLNLNARAFRNLFDAQNESGFLSETLFWAEIYPTAVKDEHLSFLRNVGTAYLGIGMQSMDEHVLKAHSRPFDMRRFVPAVDELSKVAGLEIQIIMGLPEDTPEGFRKTLQFALSLPVDSVRVYHCLVLPDGLLSRAKPHWKLAFDPISLTMVSNNTWSKEQIHSMRMELTELAYKHRGQSGDFWWSFRR